ncbi:hypothetical protein M378DRAFT_204570 [Amanita muscaria Koide BX008]|uniref:Uncharacterized protein n=1 Tax=Amanita muscaria (strain Koide BX008) TaxID=946122 RepID=A0A0C2XNM5_AMAMK|nr:hypothetical protein M378DRAFT_204570 [Amanita muscaria Koide BX008]
MPRKWNMSDVWRTVKRLMHVPLRTAERDELQIHGDGGHYGTDSRSRQGAGHASGSRTRVNQRRDDTENSGESTHC